MKVWNVYRSRLMFLIHYGWRGTRKIAEEQIKSRLFLIHYGWRGTGSGVRGAGPVKGF